MSLFSNNVVIKNELIELLTNTEVITPEEKQEQEFIQNKNKSNEYQRRYSQFTVGSSLNNMKISNNEINKNQNLSINTEGIEEKENEEFIQDNKSNNYFTRHQQFHVGNSLPPRMQKLINQLNECYNDIDDYDNQSDQDDQYNYCENLHEDSTKDEEEVISNYSFFDEEHILNISQSKKYDNEFIMSFGKSNSKKPNNMSPVILYKCENIIYKGLPNENEQLFQELSRNSTASNASTKESSNEEETNNTSKIIEMENDNDENQQIIGNSEEILKYLWTVREQDQKFKYFGTQNKRPPKHNSIKNVVKNNNLKSMKDIQLNSHQRKPQVTKVFVPQKRKNKQKNIVTDENNMNKENNLQRKRLINDEEIDEN